MLQWRIVRGKEGELRKREREREGELHKCERFPNRFLSRLPNQNGLRIGLIRFGSGFKTPKRFRLNRFGLDQVKPAKPKPNRCRSLIEAFFLNQM